MTTTYQGPATLIDETGAEHDTTANLHIEQAGRLRSWGGHLDLAEDVAWAAFGATNPLTLRLPDGREGQVIVKTGSQVIGSGPAPFSP